MFKKSPEAEKALFCIPYTLTIIGIEGKLN